MKKLYTLIGATLLTAAAFGQVEIRLFETGTGPVGNDISGTTYTMNVTSDGIQDVTFNVKNVSGGTIQYNIARLRLNTVAGWTDGLCWGPYPDPNFEGQCYGAGQMATNPWMTPNNPTFNNNGAGNLVVDIHTVGGGCGNYRYYVMDGMTRVDSIDVEVCSVAGVNEEVEEPLGMTAYPNPANNQLTINTTGVEGAVTLRITDVLGKVVYNEEVPAVKKVDVSDFKNGVYLVTVLEKGTAIQTRRVVVKH